MLGANRLGLRHLVAVLRRIELFARDDPVLAELLVTTIFNFGVGGIGARAFCGRSCFLYRMRAGIARGPGLRDLFRAVAAVHFRYIGLGLSIAPTRLQQRRV